jgi:hypothetical protein
MGTRCHCCSLPHLPPRAHITRTYTAPTSSQILQAPQLVRFLAVVCGLLWSTLSSNFYLLRPSRHAHTTPHHTTQHHTDAQNTTTYYTTPTHHTTQHHNDALHTTTYYTTTSRYDTRGSGKTYHEGNPSPAFDIPRSWTADHYLPPHYPSNYGNGMYAVCCQQPFTGTCVDEGNSGGGFCRIDNESAIFDYVQANHTIGLLRTWKANTSVAKQPFFYAVGWKLPHAPWHAPSRMFDVYEPVDDLLVAGNKYRPLGAPSVALITDFFVRLEGNSTTTAFDWSADLAVPDYVARRNRQAYAALATICKNSDLFVKIALCCIHRLTHSLPPSENDTCCQ